MFIGAGLHARGSHGLGSLKAALYNETLHLPWASFVVDVTIAPAYDAIECSGFLPVLGAGPEPGPMVIS